jgi:hypothetical protein
MKTDSGRDMQYRQMAGDVAGASGTSTATGATSMTDTGATWGTTQYVGHWVFCGNRYGVIISHTGTVLTIDRWYDPASPGGAAGSTPGATTVYVIAPSAAPAWYMALTANVTGPANGDTTLAAEITTGGGGLIRKLCPVAHTAGASTYTLTPVYTANGSDALPVTIGKVGVFNSIVSGQMLFETLLGTTATLSLSGDQLTITDTVTM